MAALDYEKIRSRLLEIDDNLEKIEKYSGLDDDVFWSDERNIYTIKHLLLESIEATGSIGAHLAAKKLHHAVSSFGECFAVLGEKGVIRSDLAAKLRLMAKFRNFLVHQYWQVDNKKVLDYARDNLQDFRDFSSATKNLLSD